MNTFLKLAVSSLVLGAALMGNAAGGAGVSAPSHATEKAERQAAKFAAKANKALKARDADKAVTLAEQAVLFDPDNAEHRALLGQAYLLAGRFASAATAFRDTLTLNPNHGRAGLSLALAETAYGRVDAARSVLAQSRQFIPAPDYGLALALAGDKEGAIAVLEAAARSESVTPKTRQNLALAYALAGRWKEAQITAAQDVPAEQMTERMTQWAQFARPQAASDQVASLLGVKPTIDAGQPQQLALLQAAPAPEPVAVAAVAEEPAPAAPAPIEVTQVAPAAPAPQMAAPVARAAESIFLAESAPKPAPMIRQVNLPASKPAPLMQVAAIRSAPVVRPQAPRPAGPGKFVVQLGAFSSAAAVEAAWNKYSARSQRLSGYVPVSTTFRSSSKALVHRLAVGGFASRSEAWTLCGQVRAKGGQCFVRGTAGDAPMQFASRAKAAKPIRLASN